VLAGWIVGLDQSERTGDDTMKKELKEIQELNGIGKVLSRRLIEASYNTIAKVAAAEEHGLAKIPGMNPQKVRSVITQARGMASEAEKSRPKTWKH
jgi:predicted flap endonuclease-1-like 5' DNA nuclease